MNVYNIEQNEIEDPLAKEIHQLITYGFNLGELNTCKKKKSKSSYNKNYVTKSNLLINGIFNNTNYVNKIIYLDFRDSK